MSESTYQDIPGTPGWQVMFKSRGQQRGVDRYLRAPDGKLYSTIRAATSNYPGLVIEKNALNALEDVIKKKFISAEGRFMSSDSEFEKKLMKQRAKSRQRGVLPATQSSGVFPIRARMKDNATGPTQFHDPSVTLKYRPRLIVAPPWFSKIVNYTHTLEEQFSKHPHYFNQYVLNDALTVDELRHFGIDTSLAGRLFLTSNKYLDFGSLLLLATENIRTIVESWKTGFQHFDKKVYNKFHEALRESEIRCDPSRFVEGMGLLLQSLRSPNLGPTIGTTATRSSLISSMKTQSISQVNPSLNNGDAHFCCCCHTWMKPSEVTRLGVRKAQEEEKKRSHRKTGKRGGGVGGGRQKKNPVASSKDSTPTAQNHEEEEDEYSESDDESDGESDDNDDDTGKCDSDVINSVMRRLVTRVVRHEGMSSYERLRQEKIKRNNKYLESLGITPISTLHVEEKKKGKKKKTTSSASDATAAHIQQPAVPPVQLTPPSTTTSSTAPPPPSTAPPPPSTTPPPPSTTSPPKKPLTAYNLFMLEKRVEVVAAFPAATFGEIGKRIGSMWRELTAEARRTYSKRAAEDKKRYEKALKAFYKANPPAKPSHMNPPPVELTEKTEVLKDPELLDLPCFVPHPIFSAYFCLPCANHYADKMRTFTFAAVTKPSKRPNLSTPQPTSLANFQINEEEAKDPNEYMCELCGRHAAPRSTPLTRLTRDAAINTVCTRKGCDSSYCHKCILFLCGGAELNLAKNVPGWICFACRDANFVKPDYENALFNFLQPDNPALVNPYDAARINETETNQMNMQGYEEAAFTLESFRQQQFLIDDASKKNKNAQLTKRDLSFFAQSGLRVLSLFGGIEASLVAIKQLSLKIDLYVSVEKDEDARKVTAANHVDLLAKAKLIFVNDILDVDASMLSGLQKAGAGGGFHLIIGGSPCQDFSFQGNLNGGERPGLEGHNGKLVYEFFRVLSLVERMNARLEDFPKPAFVYENVAGMDGSIKREISKWLGVEPTRLNADLFSPASRPRDFYTNLPVELLPGDTTSNALKIPTLQQILTSPAQALTDKAKCIITSNGAEVFATGRTNYFYEVEKKWIDHFNRVYRNRYDHSLGYRNLQIEEVEKLQGLPPGYMSVVNSARSKDFHRCWSLLGNMFSIPVCVYLLSPFLANAPVCSYHSPTRYPFEVSLLPRIPLPEDSLVANKTPPTASTKPITAEAARETQVVIVRKKIADENNTDYNNDEIESDEEEEILAGPSLWVPGLDSLPKRFQFCCCDKCNTWRRIPSHVHFDDGEEFTCEMNTWATSKFERTCQFSNRGKEKIADGESAAAILAAHTASIDLLNNDDEMEIVPELPELSQDAFDELQVQLQEAREEIKIFRQDEAARLLRQQDLIAQLSNTVSVPSSVQAIEDRAERLIMMQQDNVMKRARDENVEKAKANVTPSPKKQRRGRGQREG